MKPKCKGRCVVALEDVTANNVMELKRINQAVLPVSYNDKFYKKIVTAAGELAKLVFFNDIVAGGVSCRVDTSGRRRRMYIMTLGCLAPYRRIGLGTLMLDHVFALCRNDATIESIFLHVQVNNEDAIQFYEKCGFLVAETADDDDAYVMEKWLRPPDGAVMRNGQPAP